MDEACDACRISRAGLVRSLLCDTFEFTPAKIPTGKEQNSDILGMAGKSPEAGGLNLLQGYTVWY